MLCVELRDPTTRKCMWSLPGGEIEAGETPDQTAVRETLEETGHAVEVDPASRLVSQYFIRWDARTYDCTNHWFLARPVHPHAAAVDDADYLLGSAWIPVERIRELLAWHPHIQQTVLGMIGWIPVPGNSG